MEYSEFFKEANYWNKSLSEYVAESRVYEGETLVSSYHPVPADYLIAADFSFLLARNVHGWVGNASDKIVVPYDPDGNEIHDRSDFKETNFYSNIVSAIAPYNTKLRFNHYGVTICATESPSTLADNPGCYDEMGVAPTDRYTESYRHGNNFVKDTKWLDVLDYVFGTGTFEWGKYDMLSGEGFTPKER